MNNTINNTESPMGFKVSTSVLDSLGLIILNYNNLHETMLCLESIWDNISGGTPTIIVVDNNSDNNEADYLKSVFGSRITVLKSPVNYGYARGNNLGIKYAIDLGLDYICILNNDTLLQENFFPNLINYLDTHPEVAFVSPAIVYPNMRVQSTGGTINPIKGTTKWYNFEVPYEEVKDQVIDCDILSGACILLRSNYIKALGYIPEAYFLFYEETEWCYKAKKKGFKCVSFATHYIVHKSSVSIKREGDLQVYLMERNKVVFSKRNASFPAFICFLVYDICRTIWQGLFEGIPAIDYFKYHIDGLFENIDKRYPFIWVNKEN